MPGILLAQTDGAHATTADCDTPFHPSESHGFGQGNDKIGIVIKRIQLMGSEINDLVTARAEFGQELFF
jgi:hypothetical protein